MKRLLSVVVSLALLATISPVFAAEVDLGGQYMVRAEYRDNANWISSRDNFVAQRMRLTAKVSPGENLDIKLTLQDTRIWGDGSTTGGPSLSDNGTNVTDLNESYLAISDFFGTTATVKVGRQKISLGNQRLVGAFEWNQNARSFDAVTLNFLAGDTRIFLAGSKIASQKVSAEDSDLYIAYVTLKATKAMVVDLYYMFLKDESATDLALTTYGVRMDGKAGRFSYNLEVPFQTGDIGTSDIDAWAAAAKVGYSFGAATVGAEYVMATGDDSATASTIETFYNLYPTNHLHMGGMDRSSWRNLEAYSVSLSSKMGEKVKVKGAYWVFNRESSGDGIYYAGNTNTSTPSVAGGTGDAIGTELDLTLDYAYSKGLTVKTGISQFFIDEFIESSVGALADDQTWGYLMLVSNF